MVFIIPLQRKKIGSVSGKMKTLALKPRITQMAPIGIKEQVPEDNKRKGGIAPFVFFVAFC
jgi:hypothetical protein